MKGSGKMLFRLVRGFGWRHDLETEKERFRWSSLRKCGRRELWRQERMDGFEDTEARERRTNGRDLLVRVEDGVGGKRWKRVGLQKRDDRRSEA